MKHYIYYLTTIVMAALLTGCSLDEENRSNVSTDEEWSTAEGYEKLINNCYYDLIRIVYGQAEDTFVTLSETGTDIWQHTGCGGGWQQVASYDGFGASSGQMLEAYAGFYATLNSCNAAIQYADIVQGLSESEVAALVAEAHFLRAHSLFNIVEYFGGKYLPTTYTESPVSTLPMSPVNDFYEVILSDLEFAMQNLPVSQSVRGHVTRAAAYHLYAKACLTYSTYTDGLAEATPLTESESKNLLDKAKTAADYLIGNASSLGVELYGETAEVFADENNKTNKEALFIVTHSSVTAYNPRGNYFNRVWKHFEAFSFSTDGIYLTGLQPSYETSVAGIEVQRVAKGNCYFEPSKYYLSLYDDRRDTRYDAYFKDTYYVNAPTEGSVYKWSTGDANRYGLSDNRVGDTAYDITVGDTAVYLTRDPWTQDEKDACRYAVYNIEDNYADEANPKKFFPSLSKFDNPTLYAGSNASKPYSYADCIIYRLAETYLLAAEIYWRLGDNQTAAERLNVVRNRACKDHDGGLNIGQSDMTQDLLLDEYAREMGGEWMRWTILKRFRALESRIATCNPQITKFDKSIHYLRPIPTQEILLIENGSAYQNPGY